MTSKPPFADVPMIGSDDIRNELAAELDAALLDDFRQNGRAGLARLRQKSPAKYFALVAARAGWESRAKGAQDATQAQEATFLQLLQAINERRLGGRQHATASPGPVIEGTMLPPPEGQATGGTMVPPEERRPHRTYAGKRMTGEGTPPEGEGTRDDATKKGGGRGEGPGAGASK